MSIRRFGILVVVLLGAGGLAAAGYLVAPADVVPGPVPMAGQALLPAGGDSGPSLTITIQDGARRQLRNTAAQTVGQALQEANIIVNAADGVEPPPNARLTPGMRITVRRASPLAIHADGRIIQTSGSHSSVGAALAEAGISLVGADYSRPGREAALQPGDTIYVIRVAEDLLFEDTPIPYQTIWQASAGLELDSRAVISAGAAGLQRQRFHVRYENGVEVSRAADGDWMVREPANEVIGYGTRIVVRTLDTPDGPLEYWRVVRMRVTSYTAATSGKERGDPDYGITASGVPAGKGVVAVDRSIVPFRSYVYVPGYGRALAGDTGGEVRGRWIDLGYEERRYRPWSGYVDVYYLTPVPPPQAINYLLPDVLP